MTRNQVDSKDKVVTGMLVKRDADYEFFRRYFDNNWMQIQACNSFASNSNDEIFGVYGDNSHFEGLFHPFFHGTLVTLGLIVCFGFVYESCRRKSFTFRDISEKLELCQPYPSNSRHITQWSD